MSRRRPFWQRPKFRSVEPGDRGFGSAPRRQQPVPGERAWGAARRRVRVGEVAPVGAAVVTHEATSVLAPETLGKPQDQIVGRSRVPRPALSRLGTPIRPGFRPSCRRCALHLGVEHASCSISGSRSARSAVATAAWTWLTLAHREPASASRSPRRPSWTTSDTGAAPGARSCGSSSGRTAAQRPSYATVGAERIQRTVLWARCRIWALRAAELGQSVPVGVGVQARTADPQAATTDPSNPMPISLHRAVPLSWGWRSRRGLLRWRRRWRRLSC
jgi:hypothetical protein